MENSKKEELKSTNKSECRLKLFKQVNEKEQQIQRGYFSYLEPDEKALIQRGPLIQYEREIYSQIYQKHEKLCKSNETKELFSVIFQELLSRNLSQLKNYNNRNKPFHTKIRNKTKKIKRSTILQSKLNKFNLFIKKIKRKKLQKQQEKHIYINNQISNFQTQIVKFNLENQITTDIKIFINTDFLLNIKNEEYYNKNKTEVKIKVLDSILEGTKLQDNQCLLKNEKIVVSLRKSPQILIEDSEKEPELNNKSKKISFKELICKIDLENKLNQKKLFIRQNLQQVITNPQQKLYIFNEIEDQEIIINDQNDIIQKEEQQKKEQEITLNIQPFQSKNEQELQSPDKNQGITKNILDVDITKIDFHKIKNDSQNNTSEEDSCQIIENYHYNQILVEQQNKQRKKDINQQNFPENKREEHNGQNFESTQQVIYNQNKINILEKFKFLKNEETQNTQEGDKNLIFQKIQQFCNENKKSIKKERFKFLKQQRQLEKQKQRQIQKERKKEIIRQLELEREREKQRQREIEIQIGIDRELEKERIKQKERDRINEIKKKIKLEKQIEKIKQKEKLKEQHIKFCKENNKKERNRSQNRKLRQLSNLSQQYKSEEQDIFQEQNSENNKQQDQQQFQQQIYGNQFVGVSDLYKSKQMVIGQQYKQQEETNLNQNSNTYQYNHLYPLQIPYNIFNYCYQDQAISQFQVPMAIQPNPSNISNPYFYHQFMPINQIQQQTFNQNDGSNNLQKNQQQLEMVYFQKKTSENFDQTSSFQSSPQTFVSIPERSKLGVKFK